MLAQDFGSPSKPKSNAATSSKQNGFKKENLFLGGNLSLQFGSITYVDISPLVGYNFTERLAGGVGTTYIYLSDKNISFETHVYGGRIFQRFLITPTIFAYAEEEVLNLEAFDLFPTKRVNVTSVMLGGGFIQRFGENSGITATILYNFTESVYTPYTNPIFRIGIFFGL